MTLDQTKIDPTGVIPASGEPATTNLSADEAAGLMSTTVQKLRQQWLQSAVTIANVLKGGQTIHRGTFDDLRQLRENYEELERARLFLKNMAGANGRTGATGAPTNGD